MHGTIRLIDDYIDNELSDSSFVQFTEWLRTDPNNIRQFAYESLVHSLLYDLVSERRVQTDALANAAASNDGDWAFCENKESGVAVQVRSHDFRPRPAMGWRMRWRQYVVGLAALTLFATMIAVLAYQSLRPHVAAMLTQTADCRWQSDNDEILNGTLLHSGRELRLVDGRALLTFVSGAQVALEGPAVLRLDSPSAATLTTGHLSAKVPPQAVGFAVDTSSARFVDLGTEFSVRLLPKDSAELHVFDGLVEVRTNGTNGNADEPPLRISEGTAVRIDGESHEVKSLRYDVTQQIEMH